MDHEFNGTLWAAKQWGPEPRRIFSSIYKKKSTKTEGVGGYELL